MSEIVIVCTVFYISAKVQLRYCAVLACHLLILLRQLCLFTPFGRMENGEAHEALPDFVIAVEHISSFSTDSIISMASYFASNPH